MDFTPDEKTALYLAFAGSREHQAPFMFDAGSPGAKAFLLVKRYGEGVGTTKFMPYSKCTVTRLENGFVLISVPAWLVLLEKNFFNHQLTELHKATIDALRMPEMQKQQLLHNQCN